MKDLCVLMHTCDAYKFLWEGWYRSFFKHMNFNITVYWVNENIDTQYNKTTQLKTGGGEWSNRLIYALDNIKFSNILYIQEDMWPIKTLDLPKLYNDFLDLDMSALRMLNNIYKNDQYYTFENIKSNDEYLKFSINSNYLVSHQPSIWKKEFLKQCLKPNENPWVNEIEGTKRLKGKNTFKIFSIRNTKWYEHVCRKGQLLDNGKKILKEFTV